MVNENICLRCAKFLQCRHKTELKVFCENYELKGEIR